MKLSLNDVYLSMPLIGKKMLFDLYSRKLSSQREGCQFIKKLDVLQRQDFYTSSQIKEYQNARIKEIVAHAYETVPYYNEVMRSLKLRPRDIQSIEDLWKLPLLTKSQIRNNYKKLISRSYSVKSLVKGNTSGTTGSPLTVYWDKECWQWSHAFDWRQKSWAGVRIGEPMAMLLGRTVVEPGRKKPPFWMWNKYSNQLWVSSFHLSAEYIGPILDEIRRKGIYYLEGYPSTLSAFAYLVDKANEKINLKATFTSSEPLREDQKSIMARVFQCPNYDYYGLAEKVIWATECNTHVGKHVNFEYGITEIVDAEGNPLAVGENGFAVGTSLLNYGMPLLRYLTSDRTHFLEKSCTCGRSTARLSSVLTKNEDMIVLKDGRLISPSILTHPFKPLKGVMKSQIWQPEYDRMVIRLVVDTDLTGNQIDRLKKDITARMGGQIDVNIEIVDDIPASSSGKYRWVVSDVNRNL